MKKKLSKQDGILKRTETMPAKFTLNSTNGCFMFKFNYNNQSGKIFIDKDFSGNIEDLFKNNAECQVLTEKVIEQMKSRIENSPRKAMEELPLAFLELPVIKECFDINLGKIYTKEFAKLFGIKLTNDKDVEEVDVVRREVFEDFKKEKKYVPNKQFENNVISRIKYPSSYVSPQMLYTSVSSTQKYFDLMTLQVADACKMGSRLYNLHRNRHEEAIKAKESFAQA